MSTHDWKWADIPHWLCWLINRHKKVLRYADYNVDVAGWRCYCGKIWEDEP